jgi:hypothetical protein
MSNLVMKDKIQRLKEACVDLPQTELPTEHFFLDGMYLRQCFIPKGTCFVGRVHKRYHYFMLMKGAAEVTLDEKVVRMTAGMVFICPPGTRRAGVTLEDTVFAGVLRTDSMSVAEVEEEYSVYDPTARFGVGNELLPGRLKHETN